MSNRLDKKVSVKMIFCIVIFNFLVIIILLSIRSSICPNCQESCDSTKKIFLDFDKRDCNNCEQYSLMMEIKEAHIDKLNKNSKTIKDLKEENAKNQRKCDELSGKLTNTVKELKEKDNELATHHQIIEILKTEINALRITNNIENMAPKIEQTENSDVIPALAPIKSHLVQK